jgi:hypothetical protein
MLDAKRVPSRDRGGLELKIAQARFDDRSENPLPLLEVDHSTIVINFGFFQKDRKSLASPRSAHRPARVQTAHHFALLFLKKIGRSERI